jgi:hypothetical protein
MPAYPSRTFSRVETGSIMSSAGALLVAGADAVEQQDAWDKVRVFMI